MLTPNSFALNATMTSAELAKVALVVLLAGGLLLAGAAGEDLVRQFRLVSQ
jgi:hypothetical protein